MRVLPLVLLLAACTGEVSDPRGLSPRDGPSQPRGPDVVDVADLDDDMRAENASLFASALKYFPGTESGPGPKRLARLTRTQLELTTQVLLPSYYQELSIPRDPLQTNYEYAENLGFNAANFTPYTAWVEALGARVRRDPTRLIACQEASCQTQRAKEFLTRAFRHDVSVEALERFVDRFATSVGEVGLAEATGELVELSLSSPRYVFRNELTSELTAARQLQHLSYTLTDSPPEALGLSPRQVLSQDELQKTVDAILETPQARAKLMRFFVAWLEVRAADEFTIDTDVFPEFTPALVTAMLDETRAFLENALGAVSPKLSDVTQSNRMFVSDVLEPLYGGKQLDPNERLGIFTQPAVIASHSGPTTTRVIKRGVFFTRKVMCLPLGNPPAGVNTAIPELPNASERQRIENATSVGSCKGCHAYINPFGFMQESFDPLGRFRSTDQGRPIDVSVTFDFLDEGPLQTDTSVEALKALTSSLRFQQCFARQLFRFYMGRDELEVDNPTLRQMFFGFANNDEQDIVRMLRTLAGSPSFSRRAEVP